MYVNPVMQGKQMPEKISRQESFLPAGENILKIIMLSWKKHSWNLVVIGFERNLSLRQL